MSSPLITFALFAYKQERFIREAVAGALAQTYSPLEVILSDDCSPDRTFEIMQEMAKAYSGPHKIILNRCEPNGGVAHHINAVVKLAKGELLVCNAGDDISFPERTQKLFEAWEKSGRKAMSIFSNALVINMDGKVLAEKYFPTWSSDEQNQIHLTTWGHVSCCDIRSLTDSSGCLSNWVLGATLAFHRKTFEVFGPLFDGLFQEDWVIPLRSQLLGTIVYVNEPLICYRRHEGNYFPDGISVKQRQSIAIRHLRQQKILNLNRLSDLETARRLALIEESQVDGIMQFLKYVMQINELHRLLLEGQWLKAFVSGIKYVINGQRRLAMGLWIFQRLSPRWVGVVIQRLKFILHRCR